MDRQKLAHVRAEICRFVDRANDLEAEWNKGLKEYEGSREGGALRRASMDLTRALADLRRSR